MTKIINIPGRFHSTEQGNVIGGADEILDDSKGKKQNVINAETDAELQRLNESKQDNITIDVQPTEGSNNPVSSGGVYAKELTLQQAITAILVLIPSAATQLNKLADVDWVTSQITMNTATFRGTYNSFAELQAVSADNNDYGYVRSVDRAGNTIYSRYKYVTGTGWVFEYDINNTGFTADEWNAIRSGITAELVAKLSALPTAAQLITQFDAKQNTLTFDNVPTLGSANPVKSGGVKTAIDTVQGNVDNVTALIPSEATTANQLADKAYVVATILAQVSPMLATALNAIYGGATGDYDTFGKVEQKIKDEVLRATARESYIENTMLIRLDQQDQAISTLNGNTVIPVANHSAVTNPEEGIIYRQQGTDSYTDWMYYDGQWMPLATYSFPGLDNEPTSGSNNIAKSGGTYDFVMRNAGAYDVSVNFPTGGTEGGNAYTLANAIAKVPANIQKGGLKIKFIEYGHNEYVEYFLKNSTWSTNVSMWQRYSDASSNPEYNVSILYPTGGTYGTNIYTLAGAIGVLDSALTSAEKVRGVKVIFYNSASSIKVYYFTGSSSSNFGTESYWSETPDFSDINRIERRIQSQEEVLRQTDNTAFYITDSEGNIIIKIDANGVQAVEYKDKLGNTLTSLLAGKASSASVAEILAALSGKASKSEVDALGERVTGVTNTFKSDLEDSIYITDSEGNVIAKIDANGLDAAKIGNNLKAIIGSLFSIYDDPMYSKEFLVVDSAGYIAFRIYADGSAGLNFQLADNSITTPKIQDKSVTPSKIACLSGYTLYSFGDSISIQGLWQNRVSEITGCIFDNDVNVDNQHPLSVGGMSSFGTGFFNLLWRVKNLIIQNEEKHLITDGGEKAIFVLQNTNDAWGVREFVQSANTFIPGDVIDAGLVSDFNATVLQNIPLASRTLNTVLKLSNIVQGTNVKIVNLPVREGNVKLSITLSNTGTIHYNMHMVPQATEAATLAYCLERILEYEYVDVNDTLADDQVSVDFSEAGSGAVRPTITFTDTDNTGMTVLISDTDNAKTAKAYYFTGSSVQDADWAVTSNWQIGISFSEGLKSSIELLKRTFPKAHVFLSMFPVFNVTPSDYLTAKGTYDHEAFYESTQEVRNRALITAYNSAAAYYNIPMLNLYGESGIELDNVSTYFYDSNVHPKLIGYNRFGEVLSAQLARYFKN